MYPPQEFLQTLQIPPRPVSPQTPTPLESLRHQESLLHQVSLRHLESLRLLECPLRLLHHHRLSRCLLAKRGDQSPPEQRAQRHWPSCHAHAQLTRLRRGLPLLPSPLQGQPARL